MDVDFAAFGVFVTIAGVIALSLWSDFRLAEEKRQRLEKMPRH